MVLIPPNLKEYRLRDERNFVKAVPNWQLTELIGEEGLCPPKFTRVSIKLEAKWQQKGTKSASTKHVMNPDLDYQKLQYERDVNKVKRALGKSSVISTSRRKSLNEYIYFFLNKKGVPTL